MVRKVVNPEENHVIYKEYGYSPAIESGGFLFVSGQVGVRADGSVVEDPAAQIEQAFQNLSQVLEAGGTSYSGVVDVTTFQVNDELHGHLLGPIKEKYFDAPAPNWTAVGVVSLAEGLIFEIKVIARVGE